MDTHGTGRIRIGTSNIALPMPRYQFPEPYNTSSRLRYYASLFDTLEVNSSFYRLPRQATLLRWTTEVPQDFQFTLKVWREVTHVKGLPPSGEAIRKFMELATAAGRSQGCLLLQFPASITVHFIAQVAAILEQIASLDPENRWHRAVEFRHSSWYSEHTHRLLKEYKAALVLHDMPASKPGWEPGDTGFEYIRLHGPAGNYAGSYHPEFLEGLAEDLLTWSGAGKDVYVYFNNTRGDAFANARMLQDLLR